MSDESLTSRPSSSGRRVLVLGVGNLLMRDDGIAVHVAQLLSKWPLPAGVEVAEVGTAPIDALLACGTACRLIIIDAVTAHNQPGTIYRARFEGPRVNDLIDGTSAESCSMLSFHQDGVRTALAAAQKLGRAPDSITIIGIEPKDVGYGLDLSDPVRKKIPKILDVVVEEIRNVVHAG